MEIGGTYVSKAVLVIAGVVVVALIAGIAYFAFGNSSSSKSGSSNNAPTFTQPKAATQAPTIATGTGAAKQISGYKMTVQVSNVPQIQNGQWAVNIAVQGGKTITPTILNCAKGCGAKAEGYTLPPLTVPGGKNATVIITAKCTKSTLPIGIDCGHSQVLASYK